MSFGLFANISSQSNYKNYITGQADRLFDYEYIYSAINSTGVTAAEIETAYLQFRQRRPFYLEYYHDENSNPQQIMMYINPSKLSFSQSKIVSKQIARGGIFYHHYGEDHATMSLSGTTGMSAMKGLKRLEMVFHASGTLLAYKNYMPTQMYGNIDSYEIYDYSDPFSIVENINEKSNNSNIDTIIKKVYNAYKDEVNKSDMALGIYLIESANSNSTVKSILSGAIMDTIKELNKIDSNEMSYKQYYKKVKKLLKNKCNLDDSIIESIALDLSEKKYYSDYSSSEIVNIKKQLHGLSGDSSNSVIDNTINQITEFNKNRDKAIKKYYKDLKKSSTRDTELRKQLRSGLASIESILKDKWLPRLITIYFENRAYLGFFENYEYNRDATSNLVNYSMKFTVVKQIEFNSLNAADDMLSFYNVDTTSTVTSVSTNSSSNSSSTSTSEKTKEENKVTIRDDWTYLMYRGNSIQQLVKKYYPYSSNEEFEDMVDWLYEYNGLTRDSMIIEGQAIKVPDYAKYVQDRG